MNEVEHIFKENADYKIIPIQLGSYFDNIYLVEKVDHKDNSKHYGLHFNKELAINETSIPPKYSTDTPYYILNVGEKYTNDGLLGKEFKCVRVDNSINSILYNIPAYCVGTHYYFLLTYTDYTLPKEQQTVNVSLITIDKKFKYKPLIISAVDTTFQSAFKTCLNGFIIEDFKGMMYNHTKTNSKHKEKLLEWFIVWIEKLPGMELKGLLDQGTK